ncbi:MAG: phosphotransferase family protein [Candidatus Eiseniibacteriota bacterium]
MRPDDLRALAESPALRERLQEALRARAVDAPGRFRIGYVRHKPEVGCLFGLHAEGSADDTTPLGYLKVFHTGSAQACHEKYVARAKHGGWILPLPELDAVFFGFPLDRNVRALPFVTSAGRLKHVLHGCVADLSPEGERVRAKKSSVRLLKYKPERRCIVQADLSTKHVATGDQRARRVIVQANGDDSGVRVHRVLEHLSARECLDAGLLVPRPLGYDSTRRILVQEWVPGRPLGEILEGPGAAGQCTAVARMLRVLHEAPVPGGLPAGGGRELSFRASTILRDLARVGGDEIAPLARRLDAELARAGSRARAGAAVLVHGDLHYHQILIEGDVGRLIDWDESATGEGLVDVGNFVAHLHLREIEGALEAPCAAMLREEFVRAYFAPRQAPADLELFVALQLVLLSMTPFRRLSEKWASETRAILQRSRDLLRVEAGVGS